MELNSVDASMSSKVSHDCDILLPNHSDEICRIAVDIGGSLAKIVYFTTNSIGTGGRLNFYKFETLEINKLIEFIRKLHLNSGIQFIIATGGGAHKFQSLITDSLGVQLQKEDEMKCLITGLNFLVREISYEVFTYDEKRSETLIYEENHSEFFPYILVNIGSGVSIIKVTDETTHERISGTSLGGGTLWGLLSLLTNAKTYDEMLELSSKGDNKNVDMLVGDIYGGDYSKIGLKGSTIASSFGKVFKFSPQEREDVHKEDISSSLLYLVSNNIAQIAYLNAKEHRIAKIYFSGNFISGHPQTMNTISYGINFWSKGEMKALFLRHEGYLGALGAFLCQPAPMNTRKSRSFHESFINVQKISPFSPSAVGVINETPTSFFTFPLLLDPEIYHPDTLQLDDSTSQLYWIERLDSNLEKIVEMASAWENVLPNTKERANNFKDMFRNHLTRLKKEPKSYGLLTVRGLLDLREQCLHEMGFGDIFKNIKESENQNAIAQLSGLLEKLDQLSETDLFEKLIDHMLAGNMFDWGATSILTLFQEGNLHFELALGHVKRSKHDQRHLFKKRLEKGFKKAMIFVDNSGADIILGIIPFVRYLLKNGTQVILAANLTPSVNDVTSKELEIIIQSVGEIDKCINESVNNEKLRVISSGSGSPCINLQSVSLEVFDECESTDLVILEGMGRAIHTNFHAKFKVSCLKIGVFKNEEIARELSYEMYDGMVLFEGFD